MYSQFMMHGQKNIKLHRSIFHESSKNGPPSLCHTSLAPPFTKNTQHIGADRMTVAKLLAVLGRRILLHVPVAAFLVSAVGAGM